MLAGAVALCGCGLAIGGGPSSPAPPPAHPAAARPASTAAARPASTAAARPSVTGAGSSPQAGVPRADRRYEYASPAFHESVIGGWRSPLQAVEVFATTYINWTAATVTARLQALAEVSVGQARSAMSLAASETARDYELQRGRVANSGMVEAIAPVRAQGDEYAVVTRERTSAAGSSAYRGLAPAWHVTLATVTRVSGGLWVLSDWQPES